MDHLLERAALNVATLRPATLEQQLYAAATAGFRAVGLLQEDFAKQGEAAFKELLLSELEVAELVGISGWADQSRSARLVSMAQAEQTFDLAARLRASVVVAWAPTEPIDPVAASRHFAELCRLATPYGMRVGIEFLGRSEQVKDLAAAWQIVEVAEAPNGGLVIDSFHFHVGGSTLDMLEPVPGEKIFLAQLSDCMDLPTYELRDAHRLYPGSGSLALEQLLAALRDKGYCGYYSLELHNEDYWREDPLTVAREGLRAMRRLEIT